MAEDTRHFSPESLVKNRVEPIACIPCCSSRLELTRVDSPRRPRVIREKCAVKMEQKGGCFSSLKVINFFLYLRLLSIGRSKSPG